MSLEAKTTSDTSALDVGALSPRLREMYERRVAYVEEILNDIRAFAEGSVSEETLERIRRNHVAFHQDTVRELTNHHD